MNNKSMNKPLIREKTDEMKLICHYKQENLVIKDKLEDALVEIEGLKENLKYSQKVLENITKEKEYWKYKYNKKVAWFPSMYNEVKMPEKI